MSACEPECSRLAFFEEAAVPEGFDDDIALNYRMMEDTEPFAVSPHEAMPKPSAEEIEGNKRK